MRNCAAIHGRFLILLLAVFAAGCSKQPEQPAPQVQHIALQGAHNLRDLGGYMTQDGRRVKSGVMYRSGHLGALTDDDLRRVAALNLRTSYDFRSRQEVALAPDRLPPGVAHVSLPLAGDMDVAALYQQILAGNLDAVPLPDSYEEIVFGATDMLRTWFVELQDPAKMPALFHCTAGKDRTGIAAALLLSALGVPYETIMQDYMASNYFLHDYNESALWKARIASRFRVDAERFRGIMEARRFYLENTLRAIDARYGSVDNYLEQALGLDAGKRERLRALYLM